MTHLCLCMVFFSDKYIEKHGKKTFNFAFNKHLQLILLNVTIAVSCTTPFLCCIVIRYGLSVTSIIEAVDTCHLYVILTKQSRNMALKGFISYLNVNLATKCLWRASFTIYQAFAWFYQPRLLKTLKITFNNFYYIQTLMIDIESYWGARYVYTQCSNRNSVKLSS